MMVEAGSGASCSNRRLAVQVLAPARPFQVSEGGCCIIVKRHRRNGPRGVVTLNAFILRHLRHWSCCSAYLDRKSRRKLLPDGQSLTARLPGWRLTGSGEDQPPPALAAPGQALAGFRDAIPLALEPTTRAQDRPAPGQPVPGHLYHRRCRRNLRTLAGLRRVDVFQRPAFVRTQFIALPGSSEHRTSSGFRLSQAAESRIPRTHAPSSCPLRCAAVWQASSCDRVSVISTSPV